MKETGTAIDGLARLEAPARWRPMPAAETVPVHVAMGEAELVILGAGEAVLGHWSLPGVHRLPDAPGGAARYAPDDAGDEVLEVEEAELVAALDRVRAAVRRPARRSRRLWRAVLWVGVFALIAAGVAFGPGFLRERADGLLPQAQRVALGEMLAREIAVVAGPPCDAARGAEALDALAARLAVGGPLRLAVLPDLPVPAVALPGDAVLLARAAVLARDDPAVLAGHVVAARAGRAPLAAALDDMGTVAVARLLVSGRVSAEALTPHVAALVDAGPRPPLPALKAAFTAANVDPGPWAAATGAPGPDAVPSRPPPLDDTDWQSLRGICEG